MRPFRFNRDLIDLATSPLGMNSLNTGLQLPRGGFTLTSEPTTNEIVEMIQPFGARFCDGVRSGRLKQFFRGHLFSPNVRHEPRGGQGSD